MGWNYVATLTGDWTISDLPGAAVDSSGNLWVLWSSGDQPLAYFTVPLPPVGSSLSVSSTFINQKTQGSPSLVPAGSGMMALWRGINDDLSIYMGQLSAGSEAISDWTITNANTADGPVAALIPFMNDAFVAWRGIPSDQSFYYSNLVGIGGSEFGFTTVAKFTTGEALYNSWYSPAVAGTPDGGVSVFWKGVGAPPDSGSDNTLYYTSATNSIAPSFPGLTNVTYVDTSGTSVAPTANDRPTLAVQGTGQGATLVAVYPTLQNAPGGNQYLQYLVGTLGTSGVTWTLPADGTSRGEVPVANLLATAGPNGEAVTLTTPVAVWATAPALSDSLYLVIGDRGDGTTITGSLYVVRYTG